MQRTRRICLAMSGVAISSFFLSSALGAQEAPPPPDVGLQNTIVVDGMGPGPGPALSQRVELLGFEGLHEGKVVRGAPFSAVAISESTQTLADGNRIVRKTQTSLYRDSEGRMRREVSLPALGPLAGSEQPHSFVVIHDPVAGASYILEADQKIARKMPMPPPGAFQAKDTFSTQGGQVKMEYRKQAQALSQNVKTEALGTQDISGVAVVGTRYTWTIPAEQIGNEKPIETVHEIWNSADLEMVVMSKRSDPRFGDSTYTLTSIQRTEPTASLFEVPPDYTVTDAPAKGNRMFFSTGAGPGVAGVAAAPVQAPPNE